MFSCSPMLKKLCNKALLMAFQSNTSQLLIAQKILKLKQMYHSSKRT